MKKNPISLFSLELGANIQYGSISVNLFSVSSFEDVEQQKKENINLWLQNSESLALCIVKDSVARWPWNLLFSEAR